jgi:hypothetical protein
MATEVLRRDPANRARHAVRTPAATAFVPRLNALPLSARANAALAALLAVLGVWLGITAAMSFPMSIAESDVACAVASGLLTLAAAAAGLVCYTRLRAIGE